jgi:hypothetical protein
MALPTLQPRWFYKAGETKSGPITDEALRALFARSELPLEAKVWRHGMETWLPARNVPELFPNGVPLALAARGDRTSQQPQPSALGKWLQERPAIPVALAGLAMVFAAQILWSLCVWATSRNEPANRRLKVSGLVTLDSAPLDGGIISFRGLSGEPFGTRVSVDSGHFHVPQNKGLTAGTYRVRINKLIPAIPDEKSGTRVVKPGTELIPPCYNETSGLTAEIPKSGTNDLRFELKTK